jgi:Protein of unknown function (DUF1572)
LERFYTSDPFGNRLEFIKIQEATNMQLDDLKALFLREISTLERELDLYPDRASIWKDLPGLPNSTGTLVLHLAGNLQHFIGTTLGQTGYVRNRDLEFSARDLSKEHLKAELEQARQAILSTFPKLTQTQLEEPFLGFKPELKLTVRQTLLHLQAHLAYHLGQIDYHRRIVTGNNTSANAVALTDLNLLVSKQ